MSVLKASEASSAPQGKKSKEEEEEPSASRSHIIDGADAQTGDAASVIEPEPLEAVWLSTALGIRYFG